MNFTQMIINFVFTEAEAMGWESHLYTLRLTVSLLLSTAVKTLLRKERI